MSFWDDYNFERNKLTILPDADADFEALAKTYEKNPSGYNKTIINYKPEKVSDD